MNNPLRKKQAIRTLLETLSMSGSYAIEESRLVGFANDLIKPPLSDAEQSSLIGDLVESRHIAPVPDEMDKALKQYVITDLGRSYLTSISN